MIENDSVTKINLSQEIEEKDLKIILFREICDQLIKTGNKISAKYKNLIFSEKERFYFKSRQNYIANVIQIFIKVVKPVVLTNKFPEIVLFNTQTMKPFEELDISPRLWMEFIGNLLDLRMQTLKQWAYETIFNLRSICNEKEYFAVKDVVSQEFLDDLSSQMFEAVEVAVDLVNLKLPSIVKQYEYPQDEELLSSLAMTNFKDLQKYEQMMQKERKKDCIKKNEEPEAVEYIKGVEIAQVAQKCKKENRESCQQYQMIKNMLQFGFERLANILRMQPSNINPEKFQQVDRFVKKYVLIERNGVDEANNKIFAVKLNKIDKNNCLQVLSQLQENIRIALNLHKGEINFCELFK